jgi:LCP family protein required for cell wall assembly
VRPDDESPEIREGDETAADDHAGEHEVPPPATWAGRNRAAADDAPEADGSGYTEEFDQIERELDDELSEEEPSEDAQEESDEPAKDASEEPEVPAEDAQEEAEAPAPDATIEAEAPAPDATIETETPALADRVAAEEAAMAGLRARAAEHDAAWDTGVEEEIDEESAEATEPAEPAAADAPSPERPAIAAAIAANGNGKGKPPKPKPLWLRFLAASLVIVASMAAATSVSLLVYLTDIANGLSDNGKYEKLQSQLDDVDGGAPQTILILGSDKRQSLKGDPGRSDTTILLRVNPDTNEINLLSIPRDLEVNIPNHGTGKFNEAYSYGNAKLTLRVVEQLTGLDVNHLVNINFQGFADAVNAIDCVYIDVDHHYFNDNSTALSTADQYAEINIEAGYQRLCGYKALQYVRYRHTDNDLVRSARQQDFLREARQKVPPEKLITDRNELLKIFTDYTTSDIADPVTVLELMKTLIAARNAELREIHFPADLGEPGSPFVTASDSAIKKTVQEFLGNEPAPEPSPPEGSGSDNGGGGGGKPGGDHKPSSEQPSGPEMIDGTAQALPMAQKLQKTKRKDGDPMLDFPVFYPTRLVPLSTVSADSRAFVIDGPGNDVYHGYKMVVERPGGSIPTEYYGVSGTDWPDPPILANPSEAREIDDRDYLLYYDGSRLRLVAWKTKHAAYWVNNTLSQTLTEPEMISIATSLRELGD